jgi:hypothetical protein
MTSSPWHGGSDIPAEFEATESAEIGPASHVIRAGDWPAAMVTHPPLSLQPFFSVAPHWRRDNGLCLSGASLRAAGSLEC